MKKPTSGKQSASSDTSPQPDPSKERVTLFIDRCAWSRKLGEALTAAGIPFVAHHDRFEPAAADEEWLTAASDQAWLIVTRDRRIRYKANEHAAVAEARLHMFVLAQGGLTALETASIVVRAYPAMVARAERDAPPAFYSITRTGEVLPLKLAE